MLGGALRLLGGLAAGPGGARLGAAASNWWNNAHNPYAYTGSTPSTGTLGSGMPYTAPTNAGGNWMNGYGAGSLPNSGWTAAPSGGVIPPQFDNFPTPSGPSVGGGNQPASGDNINYIPIPDAGGVNLPQYGIHTTIPGVKVNTGYQGAGSATPGAQGTLDPMLWGQALGNAWDYSAQDAMGNVNSTRARG